MSSRFLQILFHERSHRPNCSPNPVDDLCRYVPPPDERDPELAGTISYSFNGLMVCITYFVQDVAPASRLPRLRDKVRAREVRASVYHIRPVDSVEGQSG